MKISQPETYNKKAESNKNPEAGSRKPEAVEKLIPSREGQGWVLKGNRYSLFGRISRKSLKLKATSHRLAAGLGLNRLAAGLGLNRLAAGVGLNRLAAEMRV